MAEVGVGHGLVDTVAVGVARGEMERAKEPIKPGEEAGEVFVSGGGTLVGVVPVMEGGGGDEALERAEAEADVGVDENREQTVDRNEEAEGLFGEAEGMMPQMRIKVWSTGWRRLAAAQSRCSLEWCTAWKRQRSGTVWAQRWPQ